MYIPWGNILILLLEHNMQELFSYAECNEIGQLY